MNITDRLDEIERVANAATEGPWLRVVTADRRWNEVRSPSSDIEQEGDERPVARSYCDNSAIFIADARTTVPTLVAALRAVLAVHQPVEVWEIDPANGTWVRDSDGKKVPMPSVCYECTPDDSLWAIEDGEWDEDYGTVQHPCPTVRAITEALGGAA